MCGRNVIGVAVWVLIVVPAAAQPPVDPPIETIKLFNGRDLDGLSVYIEDPAIDPAEVWKAEDGMLRATGIGNGYIRTNTPYADYKLNFEWRWPEQGGNSGVMLHLVNGDLLWPKAFEVQLAAGQAGGLFSFVDARNNEEVVSRNPAGYSTGRLLLKVPSGEKPLGQWNTLEAVADGDTVTVSVNGTQVNRMTGAAPAAGMIAWQAEGTPIDFRNITLTPLPRAKDLHAPLPTASH